MTGYEKYVHDVVGTRLSKDWDEVMAVTRGDLKIDAEMRKRWEHDIKEYKNGRTRKD